MSDFKEYKYKNTLSRKSKVLRLLWEIVCLFLFKPTPRWCLNGWRIFLLKLFGAKIGSGCKVSPSCKIWAPWNLIMGQYSVLGEFVDCYCMDKIYIGSKVAVSQRSFLCTGSHDIKTLTRPLITKPITINDHVWICAETFISPGVTIHEYAVVAARSYVIKDVLKNTVVAGNPAIFIKNREITKE